MIVEETISVNIAGPQFDAGFFYAPYIPLIMTQTPSNTPKFHTRYLEAEKTVNSVLNEQCT